jgi:hypothetical protein
MSSKASLFYTTCRLLHLWTPSTRPSRRRSSPRSSDFLFNGSYSYTLGRVEQHRPNATGSPVYDANQPNDITMRQDRRMRKFNEGDRNQQVANPMLQLTLTDRLTFTPSASYKIVDYVSSALFDNQAAPLKNLSLLGLQRVVGWNAGMDVNWTPTDRISFTAGDMHESNFQKHRDRNSPLTDASMDWISAPTRQRPSMAP